MTDTTTPADQDAIDHATEQLHLALDAVPYSIHGREGDWVDGGAEVIAAALVAGGWTPPTRDHAAADMAHRDDLAGDVARAWAVQRAQGGWVINSDARTALDRLSAVYGEKP